MVDRLTPPTLDWTEDGAPVSRSYGDVYFSREDGLSEARAVFLEGCGLPGAWIDRRQFTVAELGFGTGLNILALLELWRRTRPAGAHLHIWSVEAHPLSRDEAARAHASWPELAEASQALLARWPLLTPGQHRLDLPEFHATLDLAFGEAEPMLDAWSGQADAWFLDGFAPAANPAMWSAAVLSLIAARSAPGARVATFTVAGQVRRGLLAAGFAVEKRPGHGRKRERLEAVLPGGIEPAADPGRVAIIGGGIAGAALARALRALGVTPTLIESDRPGAGASGAPAALVTPGLEASGGVGAEGAALAFRRAVDLYARVPGAVIDQGVVRVPRDAADYDRLLTIAGEPLWLSGSLSPIKDVDVAGLTREECGPPGFWMSQALVVEPAAILATLLDGIEIIHGRVVSIAEGQPVQINLEDGRSLAFNAVVIAAGWGSHSLGLSQLRPLRGQLAWADGVDPGHAAVWGPGYAVPTRTGVLFGATHDRGETGSEADPADTARLMDALRTVRPALAGRVDGQTLHARAAIRATVRDRRPLCGPLGQGVWALTGLGGKGFVWAPALADHIAAAVTATPSPLSRGFIEQLHPRRASAMDPEKLSPG